MALTKLENDTLYLVVYFSFSITTHLGRLIIQPTKDVILIQASLPTQSCHALAGFLAFGAHCVNAQL